MSALREESNIITYKRKKSIMGGQVSDNRNNPQDSETISALQRQNLVSIRPTDEQANQPTVNNIEKRIQKFLLNNIASVIVSIIGIIIWWLIHDLPGDINQLQVSMSAVETKIESLEGNYTNLNSQVWSINRADSELDEYNDENPEILIASAAFSGSMIRVSESTMDSDGSNPFSDSKKFGQDIEMMDDNVIIGKNVVSDEDVTKKAIENKPFITEYKDNGEDVFFYGKYDENGRWDGECIINRYKDSRLTFIMEAMYDRGTLLSYRQVFKGMNSDDEEVWYVSDRKVEGEENRGETITYFFYGDYIKEFDIESISKEDILSVDVFLETIPSTIEGYYNGNTSNGKYNDDSGNAYLVKYKPDGSVRYLYVGKIKDGVAHDDSKEAWCISWGYANDGYHYHDGKFYKGNPIETKKDWLRPLTQESIDNIVNPNDFNCSLRGLVDE